MWKFSNLSSGYALWPPDVEQKHHSGSLGCYLNCDNPCRCFLGLGNQGSSLHLNSAFVPQLNLQTLNPANGCIELGETAPLTTKGFLVFDQSGDQTSRMYSSVANPYPFLSPPFPASNVNYECTSSSHVSKDHEEMHEDTEEIDALLYSESDRTYISDEESTGHSPLILGEEWAGSPPIPPKRRRLELSELDPSLMDTASSSHVLNYRSLLVDDDVDIDDAELSYADVFGKQCVESGEENEHGKREKIRMTMEELKRIIPGCESKDNVELLDEAIRYLKSLRLQAKAFDATTTLFI